MLLSSRSVAMCDCNPKTKDCITWVIWEQLTNDYNLPYSREHVMERMVPEGKFPRFTKLGEGLKARIALRLCEYKKWAFTRPDLEPPTKPAE
jgi:hypothetical protein